VRRTLKFLPLTFIAGSWGFVVFVPYLIAFGAALGFTNWMRRPARVVVASRPA
jgi:hypothetical protein